MAWRSDQEKKPIPLGAVPGLEAGKRKRIPPGKYPLLRVSSGTNGIEGNTHDPSREIFSANGRGGEKKPTKEKAARESRK